MARLAKRMKAKMKPKFKTRQHNRCELCGRSRSFIGYFKMCRLCFRKLALQGMVPGVIKASW